MHVDRKFQNSVLLLIQTLQVACIPRDRIRNKQQKEKKRKEEGNKSKFTVSDEVQNKHHRIIYTMYVYHVKYVLCFNIFLFNISNIIRFTERKRDILYELYQRIKLIT